MEQRKLQRNVQTEERKRASQIHEIKQIQGKGGQKRDAKKFKLMRFPRTNKYINAIKEADTLSENDKQIMEAIQSLPVNNELIGILAPCFIEGCIIHVIDRNGRILEHYQEVSQMEKDIQQGYEIYLQHEGCTSVEVYTQNICVIYDDGIVKFIEREENNE